MQQLTIAGTVSQVRELKQVGDKSVFNFSVSVSNGKNADGSWRDSTFYDCAIWDKRAEAVAKFLTKGTKITLTGRPSARAHEGKAYLGLTVQEFTLQGGGGDAQPAREPDTGGGSARYDDSDSIPF